MVAPACLADACDIGRESFLVYCDLLFFHIFPCQYLQPISYLRPRVPDPRATVQPMHIAPTNASSKGCTFARPHIWDFCSSSFDVASRACSLARARLRRSTFLRYTQEAVKKRRGLTV